MTGDHRAWRLVRVIVLVGAAALVGAPAAAPPAGATRGGAPPAARDGYRPADAPYAFKFPRDHASHPAFRTEWWYYTGELRSGARAFGFELTFFRVGLDRARESSPSAWAPHTLILAHAALTDETRHRFAYDETIARAALGLAGADTEHFRVWAGDWSAVLAPDGRTHELRANAKAFALSLDLDPLKPPALHGVDGVSRRGSGPGEASHYYSLTRLLARGRIGTGGDTLPVRGEAWMDHEFSSSVLAGDQAGWDWFALRLDDGRDLMLYRLRQKDGGIDSHSSGSFVGTDGRVAHLSHEGFEIEALGHWHSPHSGADYPQGWRVRVPGERLDVTLRPTVEDQELVTRSTGGVTYWEGSVVVRGVRAGHAVTGRGYVELTGYAGPSPGR